MFYGVSIIGDNWHKGKIELIRIAVNPKKRKVRQLLFDGPNLELV